MSVIFSVVKKKNIQHVQLEKKKKHMRQSEEWRRKLYEEIRFFFLVIIFIDFSEKKKINMEKYSWVGVEITNQTNS